jgi:hypothetical protein
MSAPSKIHAPMPPMPAQPEHQISPEIAALQATFSTFRVIVEEQQARISALERNASPASPPSDDDKLQPLKKLLPLNISYKNVALPAAERGELKIEKPFGRLLSTVAWVRDWLASTGRG